MVSVVRGKLSVGSVNMVGMENAVVEVVSELEAAVSAARKSVENDLWSCAGVQVSDLLGRVHRLRAQVESMELHLVREVISRGIPADVGAVDPRAYLMGALTMSPAEATLTVKLAEALGGRLVDTGEALAEGAICRERAKAIVEVVTGLPPTASTEQQEEVEAILLESAAELNAKDLRRMDKVMQAYLDPDGAEPREEAAKRKRAAHLRPNGDGTTTLKWTDTDEQMALLQAALEPLSAPRPGPDGEPDTRGPAIRRADALADLVAQVLRHGDLPTSRGTRPHLIVTVTEQAFTERPRARDHRHRRTPVRRRGPPDLLRRRRHRDPPGHRRGAAEHGPHPTDRQPPTMARPGRPRPRMRLPELRPTGPLDPGASPHSLDPGRPDRSVENLCLVCDRHHDAIHHGGWDIEMAADGKPELRPPPWVDPDRRARRNRYWETQAQFHLR